MEIFPVVHIGENLNEAARQAHIAHELGAKGVYLIDHHNGSRDTRPLFQLVNAIKTEDASRYVGVNILGFGPEAAIRHISEEFEEGDDLQFVPDSLWNDDMRHGRLDPMQAMRLKSFRPELADLSIHGGVAFKYTRTFTEDPETASAEVTVLKDTVDVVTTSGAGTGTPPSVEKIAAMKQAIGEQKLAVASGISLDNIHKYQGILDQILVASSVETYPGSGVFDKRELQDFIDAARELA